MNPYRHMVYTEARWNVEEAVLHYMANIARCRVKPPTEVWISPRNFFMAARRLAAKLMTEDLPDQRALGMWMQWYTAAGPLKVHLDINVVDDQLDFRSGT